MIKRLRKERKSPVKTIWSFFFVSLIPTKIYLPSRYFVRSRQIYRHNINPRQGFYRREKWQDVMKDFQRWCFCTAQIAWLGYLVVVCLMKCACCCFCCFVMVFYCLLCFAFWLSDVNDALDGINHSDESCIQCRCLENFPNVSRVMRVFGECRNG